MTNTPTPIADSSEAGTGGVAELLAAIRPHMIALSVTDDAAEYKSLVRRIDAALSAPLGEPVAWRYRRKDGSFVILPTRRQQDLVSDWTEETPLYTKAEPAVGAEEIRAACIEHASLNMTVEAAHNQADRITNAILSLLSGQGGGK